MGNEVRVSTAPAFRALHARRGAVVGEGAGEADCVGVEGVLAVPGGAEDVVAGLVAKVYGLVLAVFVGAAVEIGGLDGWLDGRVGGCGWVWWHVFVVDCKG